MGLSAIQRLKLEALALGVHVQAAVKNPFLPGAARDAIGSAGYLVREIVAELERQAATINARSDAVDAEFRELRRSIGSALTMPAELRA